MSSSAQMDLQRSFCVRNVFSWLKSDADGAFNNLFDVFSDVIKNGLIVDEILRNTEYLTLQELQHKIFERSNYLTIPAQEFVDNCASEYYSINNAITTIVFRNGNSL